MMRRWKGVVLGLLVVSGALVFLVMWKPPDPELKFIRELQGKQIDFKLEGDYEVLKDSWGISKFYAFDEYSNRVLRAMKQELGANDEWQEFYSESTYVSKDEQYYVTIFPAGRRDLPKGVNTLVEVARQPTWGERQWRRLRSVFTGEKLPTGNR